MKKVLFLFFVLFTAGNLSAQNRWTIQNDHCIRLTASSSNIPHYDHLEMSGQQMSTVIRWGIESSGKFVEERSLVFPMLRTIPNDTHGSLMLRVATSIPELLSINDRCLQNEEVLYVELDGMVKVVSRYSTQGTVADRPHKNDSEIMLERTIFPSTDKAVLCEKYTIKNVDFHQYLSDAGLSSVYEPKASVAENRAVKDIIVRIPQFHQEYKTDPSKGVTGSYLITTTIDKEGNYTLKPGEELSFYVFFSARREGEEPTLFNGDEEFAQRLHLLRNSFGSNLVLETPNKTINTEFAFAKIRAAESIYKTKGGFMHGPGGERYYAAIWANDQGEYINPFFPYLGYEIGNESAMNSYRHFARFMNEDYKPLPCSIIAEGLDIWDGAGDRGDAAMIAYGASRYALAKADKAEAGELWPLIEWCLEYCRLKLNKEGVVTSNTDELEGRFPSGDANLSTSSIYYDALRSTVDLGRALGKSKRQLDEYSRQADALSQAIEKYFGADLYGFHTYKYYDTCSLLRSWISIPLTVGIFDRAEGTLDALFSDYMWHTDGLLSQQGTSTYWDRSTLYALRGAYMAGAVEKATAYLDLFSTKRLLGDHVPYPIEAYPEGYGAQRHLSAESGLYCRIITEGLFGIRPTGFNSFELSPRLPEGWNQMRLSHIRAFNRDFDILVERVQNNLKISVVQNGKTKTYTIKEGKSIKITL